MVPKDKGWGMSNLGYGEKPMFCHLVDFPSSLVNLFNVYVGGRGSYDLGSGVAGLSVLTHTYTPPMNAFSPRQC